MKFQDLVHDTDVQICVQHISEQTSLDISADTIDNPYCNRPTHIVDIIIKNIPSKVLSRKKNLSQTIKVSSVLTDEKHAQSVSLEELLDLLKANNNTSESDPHLNTPSPHTSARAHRESISPHQQQHKSKLRSPGSSIHSGSEERFTPACLLKSSLKPTDKKPTDVKLSRPEVPPEVTPPPVKQSVKEQEKEPSLDSVVDEKLKYLWKKSTCGMDMPDSDSDSDCSDLDSIFPSKRKYIETSPCESPEELEFEVLITKVNSPTSFFVHTINEESGRSLDQLNQTLNKLFESMTHKQLLELSMQFDLKKYVLCCAVFKLDGDYYRGLILDIRKGENRYQMETQEILVFFIDFGDAEWVQRSRVYPLPPDLVKMPPFALWCSLSYVHPTNSSIWDSKTIRMFQKMVRGDRALRVVVSQPDLLTVMNSQGLQLEPLPVYLMTQRNDERQEEICFNHELIHLGLAKVKPHSGENLVVEDIPAQVEDLNGWDPKMEDFSSIRNSYKVDIADPGVALLGIGKDQVGRDGRRICVFFNKPRGCYRGERCPNLHIKIDKDGE